MKSKGIKARLIAAYPTLKTPLFGKPRIELFDHEFTLISIAEIVSMVNQAVAKMEVDGLPVSDYRRQGRDCDNIHLSIWSRVLGIWQKKQTTKEYLSIPFGFGGGIFNKQGHAWNISACTDGVVSFNYGRLVYDVTNVKPVKFMAM